MSTLKSTRKPPKDRSSSQTEHLLQPSTSDDSTSNVQEPTFDPPEMEVEPVADEVSIDETTSTSTLMSPRHTEDKPTEIEVELVADEVSMDVTTPIFTLMSPIRQTEDKSTQTEFCFLFEDKSYALASDHSYSFSFRDIGDLDELMQAMQERLKVKEEMLTNLKAQVGKMQKELDQYKQQEFRLENFKDDNSAIQFYTGFPNYESLLAFHDYIQPKVAKLQYWGAKHVPESRPYQVEGKTKPGRKRQLSSLDELFIVLVRLKVGLFVRDVSDRFGISKGHFSKIFVTWINFLHVELHQLFPFPPQDVVRRNMPQEFALYPTTRIIIDCTEIFVEVPSSMMAQSQTWSNYKHHNTFKVLVGISPNGQIIFVSKLWGGRVSDKFITDKSALVQHLQPGDNVMADRGFDILDILPPGVGLNIPPFKGSRAQLTAEEVEETVHIASIRIHVERAIGRIKNYHILDGILPLSLAHVSDQIFSVCAYLTNFLPPLLPPKDR